MWHLDDYYWKGTQVLGGESGCGILEDWESGCGILDDYYLEGI